MDYFSVVPFLQLPPSETGLHLSPCKSQSYSRYHGGLFAFRSQYLPISTRSSSSHYFLFSFFFLLCFFFFLKKKEQEYLKNLPLRPIPTLHTQLHRRTPPILTMIVHPPIAQPSSLQPLLLRQHRQQTEDHGHSRIQLHPHQAVADRIGNIFKVHRGTLDQHANGDDGVECLLLGRGWSVGRFAQVRGRCGEKVCGANTFTGLAGLDLRGGVETGCFPDVNFSRWIPWVRMERREEKRREEGRGGVQSGRKRKTLLNPPPFSQKKGKDSKRTAAHQLATHNCPEQSEW